MMRLTWVRFALAAIGIIVWAYGYQANDAVTRWVGIAFLAAAVVLRFAPRRRPPPA
jgi:hypothetical protein